MYELRKGSCRYGKMWEITYENNTKKLHWKIALVPELHYDKSWKMALFTKNDPDNANF